MIFFRSLLRRFGLQRWLFTLMYRRHMTPWDTNVSPPELVATVEGPDALPPGRALDLGCGTGTNSIYLAQHGWQVIGVDFTAPAIERAKLKLARAGKLSGSVRFLQGDVTHLDALNLSPGFTLFFDLGCLHGIPPAGRARYAASVARLAAPGARFLLYGFMPSSGGIGPMGITPDEVRALFTPAFTLEKIEQGQGAAGRASAWYWLTHGASPGDPA
jgi:SAM-dependent methyltransferase